jgi:hypothetical protein
MKTITLAPGEELHVVGASDENTGATAPRSGNTSTRWLVESVVLKRIVRLRKTQGGGKRGANPFMKFAAKERKNIMGDEPWYACYGSRQGTRQALARLLMRRNPSFKESTC